MNQFPFGYERIQEASWAYLSSLLMIALFFKFNRFWTMRNLDLFFVILLAPGLIMVYSGLSADQRHQSSKLGSGNTQATETQDNTNSNPQDSPTNSLDGDRPPPSNPNDSSSQNSEGTTRKPPSTESGTNSNEPNNSQNPPNPTSAPTGNDGNSGDVTSPRSPQETSGPLLPDNPRDQNLAPAIESTLTGSQRLQRLGYVWLFSVGGLFLVRMLLDPILVRRPLLDPNLSIGGMVFLGCSLMTFMFADLITAPVKSETGDPRVNGPGYRWLQTLPVIDTFSERRSASPSTLSSESPVANESTGISLVGESAPNPNTAATTNALTSPSANSDKLPASDWHGEWAAKSLVIANQIAIVLGLIFLGNYHFSNFRSGVGMACIYLMVPYTVFYSGHPLHLLPGALILWAMVAYRRPFWSGLLIGLAAGVAYYPIFLLPLWFSFYWDKGAVRFALGVVVALAVCIFGLWITAADTAAWLSQLQQMFGFWLPVMEGLRGIWSLGWDANFRLPILVGFLVLAISFVFWPARKNTGTLIAYSAAIMLAVQFWHGFGGGLYMAWYLPLTLATFFRPNLTERDAVSQLGDGWLRRFRRTDAKHSVPTAA